MAKEPNKPEMQDQYLSQYRKFGETLDDNHKGERNMLLISFVLFLIIGFIMCLFIYKGIYGFLVLIVVMFAILPVLFYAIRIPMTIVLEVNLGDYQIKKKSLSPNKDGNFNYDVQEYQLIDDINIYYIPFHIFKEDWDVMGNTPPFRSISGEYVYIADKVDIENKIIHLPFDELFSNLRYTVHKKTFIELKNYILRYLNIEMKNMFMEDITVAIKLKNAFKRGHSAIFDEMEKYVYQRDFGQKQGDIYEPDTDTLKTVEDLLKQRATMQSKPINTSRDTGDNKNA